jgi:hypothetical protein
MEEMPLVLLLILAAVVAKLAWLIAAVIAVVAIGWGVGKALAWNDDVERERRRRDAELCARADRQHAAVLGGDELLGVFGNYPPAI